MDNSEMIVKALDNLKKQVNITMYNDREKDILCLLIEKIKLRYLKQYETLFLKNESISKIITLESNITDLIVEINGILNDNVDVFEFVNNVNKKMHDEELDKYIKSKRYVL